MTDQPRPPLWRDVDNAWWAHLDTESLVCLPPSDQAANVIRAFTQYLIDHGLINTISQPTPRSGPRLLALLEEEARRAEEGE